MQATQPTNSTPANELPPERLHTRVVTVFTLLAITPLVIGLIVALVASVWIDRREAAAEQQSDAQLVGRLLDERWLSTVASLRAGAGLLGHTADQPALELVRQGCGACRALALLDRDAQVQFALGQPLPAAALSAELRAAIAAGAEALDATPQFDSAGAWALLALPTPSGALVAVIDLQRLGEQALSTDTAQRGYSYVADTHGRLIVSPQPGQAAGGRELAGLPVVAAAASGQSWQPPYSQTYVGLLGQRVDGSWARAERTGWLVFNEMPLVLADDDNWYLYGVLGLLFLLTTAAAVVLGRRMAATITEPLERLQSGVLRLRAGHWQQPVVVGRRDEIGQLAEAFSSMAGDLQTKQAELRQRGDQLALANHELEQALEAAHSANVLKSQFVATISHELRTPLTGVLGYADMLEMGVYGELEREQYSVVVRIQQNGRHLLALINDLLDFSKLEAGKVELQIEPIELREFVQSTIANLEPQAQQKRLALTSAIDPALPEWVAGDLLRLRQIVLNLLSNAIKFTEQGSVEVCVSLLREPAGYERIELLVSDTGIGIAPGHQGLIFDAFRQIDGGYSRRSEGTGLGLSITRRLVELMGGSIAVQSELGRGSRFRVILPLVQAGQQRLVAGASDER